MRLPAELPFEKIHSISRDLWVLDLLSDSDCLLGLALPDPLIRFIVEYNKAKIALF